MRDLANTALASCGGGHQLLMAAGLLAVIVVLAVGWMLYPDRARAARGKKP